MISGSSSVFAILGNPVSHSASPAMHNTLFSAQGVDAVYVPLCVQDSVLKEAVEGLRALEVSGFNVTVPHKETIMPFLDVLDEGAAAIGAVNTVINRDGELTGYNTDGLGFLYSFEHVLKRELSGASVCFLGAGGTTRSLLYAVKNVGLKRVCVLNRTVEKAESLVGDLSVDASVFELGSEVGYDVLAEADIVVNTTSVGMTLGESPLSRFDWVNNRQLCYDVIYKPVETTFLSEAKKKGAESINGEALLAGQAVYAYRLFTGNEADFNVLLEQVRRFN